MFNLINLLPCILNLFLFFAMINLWWHGGVVVISTAQLHSTKPEFRFCETSNPACCVPEITHGEDL